jgi:hypothetical protein
MSLGIEVILSAGRRVRLKEVHILPTEDAGRPLVMKDRIPGLVAKLISPEIPYLVRPYGQNLRVAAGAGKIVAADGHGLWTADPNVSSWTLRDGNVPAGVAVVWDGHQFVALTQRLDDHSGFMTLYLSITHSNDGITWTPDQPLWQTPTSPIYGAPLYDLLFTGSGFLTPKWRSGDAVLWEAAAVPEVSFLMQTATGIIGVNRDGSIYTSPDGIAWTLSVPGSFDSSRWLNGVVWTGSRLIGTYSDGSVFQGTLEAGPGRPWTTISPWGGTSIAWTGSRAIVATGKSLFTFENPDVGLPQTWSQWRQTYFSAAQLGDATISGPLTDPDGDGSVNVMEFMSGTSPVTKTAAPAFMVFSGTGNQGARFTWRQDTSRTGISVRAELSNDLDAWDELTASAIDGAAGGVRTMQATAPAGLSKVYFRLKVTLNE